MKAWRSDGSTARPSTVTHFNIRRLGFTFYDESYDVSFPGIFFLSFIPGIVGGVYGIGGMAGMYLGARCQKFVPARAIKWMLAGIMVLTAAKYVLAFFGY